MNLEHVKRLVPLLLVIICGSLSFWGAQPPAAVPADAAPEVFSAERAFEHVKAMAREPHRAGTKANRRVEAYILDTLRTMGYTPVLSDEMVLSGSQVAFPRNILVRLKGTGAGKAFLLMTHYDSVPFGPGAADDIAGVAAILETLRALKHLPQPVNDIIALINEGEEGGLLGAKAFQKHPWFKDIGLLLNYEARGTTGTSYLFETFASNSWLIPHIANSGVFAVTSSAMYDVYIRLPFRTDYTVYSDRVPGMNTAFIGMFPYYHSWNDRPEYLDRRSLQHHGEYGLGFAQYFGRVPLEQPADAGAMIYFNTIGRHLVYYSMDWNFSITIVLFILLSVQTRRLKHEHPDLWTECAAREKTLVFFLAGVGLWIGAFHLIAFSVRGAYALYTEQAFFIGTLFTVLAALLCFLRDRGNSSDHDLMPLAAMHLWALLTLGVTLKVPGMAYVFQWPLLGALLCHEVARRFLPPPASVRDEGSPRVSWAILLFLGATGIPAAVLTVPFIQGLFHALTPLFAPLIGLWITMILLLLTPMMLMATVLLPHRAWLAPALIGAGCFAHGIINNLPSAEFPRMNSVAYYSNQAASASWWISFDGEPDAWTSTFFPASDTWKDRPPLFSDREFLFATAPFLVAGRPALTLENETFTASHIRVLEFSLANPEGADQYLLSARCASPPASLSCSIEGVFYRQGQDGLGFKYKITRSQPLRFSLTITPPQPVYISLHDFRYVLPDVPETRVGPRPAHFIPLNNIMSRGHSFETDTSMYQHTFRF
jgi:hypothetical protein